MAAAKRERDEKYNIFLTNVNKKIHRNINNNNFQSNNNNLNNIPIIYNNTNNVLNNNLNNMVNNRLGIKPARKSLVNKNKINHNENKDINKDNNQKAKVELNENGKKSSVNDKKIFTQKNKNMKTKTVKKKINDSNNNSTKIESNSTENKGNRQKPVLLMLKNKEQYFICEDLLNIPTNITTGQLLGISKISKDELIKGTKNVKKDDVNIVSIINSDKFDISNIASNTSNNVPCNESITVANYTSNNLSNSD